MPPITTNLTPWRFRTATIAPGSNTRPTSVGRARATSGHAPTLAFVEGGQLLGGQKALGDGAGGVVAIRLDQAHADLESSCGKDPTQGLDRR